MGSWWVLAILFLHSQLVLLQSSSSCNPIIGMLRSQSLCTIGDSTRNVLTPSCNCGEMAALRMARTPKNIGRKFWVQSVFIFALIINWFIDLHSGGSNNVGCNFFQMVVLMKRMSSSWHKWGRLMIWRSHWRLLRRDCN